jgi:DNA-binding transcriptional LysR family regulator
MRSGLQRGVPLLERLEGRAGRAMPDWDAIRVFLDVVRCGSFRAASEHLSTSINQLRRRVDELEHHLGVKLLTRHVDGVRMTAEGEQILAAAAEMEKASFAIARTQPTAATNYEGEVRLAVTEGLGTFWLVPRLVEFQRAYPRLLIDVKCEMKSADVLRLEADVAIQITKPVSPDLKVVRLARQYISLFAARSYIDTYGSPKTKEELMKHRVVFLMAEQGRGQEYYDELFPGKPQPGFVAMRTNVSSAHYWAIAKGVGIGWLPTYAAALGGQIVPVDIDLRFPFDIWLTYHPDMSRIPRVRKLIDWLVDAFDSRRFPWFGDEFIHPSELLHHYNGEPLINMFAGFNGAHEKQARRM